MARLESQAKMGFYAISDEVVQLINKYLTAEPGARINMIDPCMGKGMALRTLAQGLKDRDAKVFPYGIELDSTRFAEALVNLEIEKGKGLNRFLSGSTEFATVEGRTMGLNYLNPPFDDNGAVQEAWLRWTVGWVAVDGILVFITTQNSVQKNTTGRLLDRYYEVLEYFKFPDEFRKYDEVVVIAKRREFVKNSEEITNPFDGYVKSYWNQNPKLLRTIGETAPVQYTVPSTKAPKNFKMHMPNLDNTLSHLAEGGVEIHPVWQKITVPKTLDQSFHPMMAMPEGMTPNILSAGALDAMPIVDAEYGRVIVKGYGMKQRGEPTVEVRDNGTKITTSVEIPVVYLTAFNIDTGEVHAFNTKDNPAEFKSFLMRNLDLFRAELKNKFTPEFDPETELAQHLPAIAEFSSPKVMAHVTRVRDNDGRKFRVVENMEDGSYRARYEVTDEVIRLEPADIAHTYRLMMPAQVIRAAAIAKHLKHNKAAGILGLMGTGKAQPLTAKILTPTGWKLMGDIKVGDQVIGSNGRPTNVLGVFPQGTKGIYKVTFTDGASTECCDDHLWDVRTAAQKYEGNGYKTLSLKEIRGRLVDKSGNSQHFIPLVQPIDFDCLTPLPIDPYLLGVLLGDGNLSEKYSVSFTTADDEMLSLVEEVLPAGVSAKYRSQYDYRLSAGERGPTSHNPLTSALRSMGLTEVKSEGKFVPDVYKFSSKGQRLLVLQGLLDTDGNGEGTNVEFCSVSQRLAEDVIFLVRSLGGTAKVSTKETAYTYNGERRQGQLAYRVNIKMPSWINPFRMTRKASQYKARTKYEPTRAIRSVEYVGEKPAQCILVDRNDHLYITDDFIVTHNTTMATLAYFMLLRDQVKDAIQNGTKLKFLILSPAIMLGKWAEEATTAFEKLGKVNIKIPGKQVHRVERYTVAEDKKVYCAMCGTKARATADSIKTKSTLTCQNCKEALITSYKDEIGDIDDAFNEPGVTFIILSYEDAKLGAPWQNAGVMRTVYHDSRMILNKYMRMDNPHHQVLCPDCGQQVFGEDEEGHSYPIRPAAFMNPKKPTKAKCARFVERPKRNDDTGLIEYETQTIEVQRPVGSVMVQDVVIDPVARTTELAWNNDGSRRMVEYRPGSKYVSAQEYETVLVDVQVPVMQKVACGSPLYQFTRMGDNTTERWTLKDTVDTDVVRAAAFIERTNGEGEWLTETAALEKRYYVRKFPMRVPGATSNDPVPTGSARHPLALYISKHYARRFYLIADEMHKFKAADSTIGVAYQWAVSASIKALGLTGTIYGGKASSLFPLMYRTFSEFRETYQIDHQDAFVTAFGVKAFTSKSIPTEETKSYGAVSVKTENHAEEANGAHPAIVKWIVPYFAQITLDSLEIELPEKLEEFHAMGLPEVADPELALGAAGIEAQYDQAAQEAFMGDQSRLSAWIQASLGWVFSPDQDEDWMHPKYRDEMKDMKLAGATQETLDEFANEHTEIWARGIKMPEGYETSIMRGIGDKILADWTDKQDRSIIYCAGIERQAYRHFYNAIKRRGLKVRIMTTDGDSAVRQFAAPEDIIQVKASDREDAIKDMYADDVQVLICNPKLVEVGIDLVKFNNIHVVGNPNPSLYTMVQAFGRIHRPGQQKVVYNHFWFYGVDPRDTTPGNNHIQALWMLMMADKMAAAAIVTGDVAQSLSALSRAVSGKSLVKELQNYLLRGEMPRFTDRNTVSFKKQIIKNPALLCLEQLMEDFDDARVAGESIDLPEFISLPGFEQAKLEQIAGDVEMDEEEDITNVEVQQVLPESVLKQPNPTMTAKAIEMFPLNMRRGIPDLFETEHTPEAFKMYHAMFAETIEGNGILAWYVLEFDPEDGQMFVVEKDGESLNFTYMSLMDMYDNEFGVKCFPYTGTVKGLREAVETLRKQRDLIASLPETIDPEPEVEVESQSSYAEMYPLETDDPMDAVEVVEEAYDDPMAEIEIEYEPVNPLELGFIMPNDTRVVWAKRIPLHTAQDRELAA